jgi:hypothetical protein
MSISPAGAGHALGAERAAHDPGAALGGAADRKAALRAQPRARLHRPFRQVARQAHGDSLDIDLEVWLPDGLRNTVTQANDHGLPLAESSAKNAVRKEIAQARQVRARSEQSVDDRAPEGAFHVRTFQEALRQPPCPRSGAGTRAGSHRNAAETGTDAGEQHAPRLRAGTRSRQANPPPRRWPPRRSASARPASAKSRSNCTSALLDNLNLSALEHASESDLRAEIASIASEALNEMSVVLNKDERLTLNQELYFEVMGLGPFEPLLKDDTVNDILVNGPAADLHRAQRQAGTDRRHLQGRTPPSAHHRQDRLGGGPASGRIQPLCGRAPV